MWIDPITPGKLSKVAAMYGITALCDSYGFTVEQTEVIWQFVCDEKIDGFRRPRDVYRVIEAAAIKNEFPFESRLDGR